MEIFLITVCVIFVKGSVCVVRTLQAPGNSYPYMFLIVFPEFLLQVPE